MEDRKDENVAWKKIWELLSIGADINAIDDDGEWASFLHTTAENSLSDIIAGLCLSNDPLKATEMIKAKVRYGTDTVDRLLQHGADPNLSNGERQQTPLHLAATNGDLSKIIQIFNRLGLDKGERSGECLEESLLDTVIDTTCCIVKQLVAKGADINARDAYLQTPLHIASSSGQHWDIAKELLSHGANVHAEDSDGRTPLHLAMKCGSMNLIKALLECGANVNAVDHQGQTPLHIKAASPIEQDLDIQSLERTFCINPENYHGKLHLELRSDSSSITSELVAHGANVNAVDHLGQTPLHVAIDSSYIRGRSMVKTLLENGANVNAKDGRGHTPLYTVFENCPGLHSVFVKYRFNVLVENGADVECRNDNGQPLAHLVCSYLVDKFTEMDAVGVQMHLDMLGHVFSHGADVNAKDRQGNTPHAIIMSLRNVPENLTQIKAMVDNHVGKLVALGAARVAEKNRSLYLHITSRSLMQSKVRATLWRCETKAIQREMYDSDYYEQCVAQVERMKATRIAGDVTLADLLTSGNPATLAKFAGNADFQEHGSEHSKFPTYRFLLNMQYEKSLELKPLCDNCETALGVISSGKINKDCAYEILKYLSEVELRYLSQVGTDISID